MLDLLVHLTDFRMCARAPCLAPSGRSRASVVRTLLSRASDAAGPRAGRARVRCARAACALGSRSPPGATSGVCWTHSSSVSNTLI